MDAIGFIVARLKNVAGRKRAVIGSLLLISDEGVEPLFNAMGGNGRHESQHARVLLKRVKFVDVVTAFDSGARNSPNASVSSSIAVKRREKLKREVKLELEFFGLRVSKLARVEVEEDMT